MTDLFHAARKLLSHLKGAPHESNAGVGEPEPTTAVQVVSESERYKREGNAALARGDLTEAVACYRSAVTASPLDPVVYINLGFGLVEQGQFSEAERILLQALALNTTLHEAHYLIGRSRREQGDWLGAKAALETAVLHSPSFDFGWLDLGLVNEQQGAVEVALRCYERARTIQPDFADAIEACARLLLKLDRHAEALNWADQLVRLRPDFPRALFLRANALFGLHRNPLALETIDAALSQDPDNPIAVHVRGNILFAMHRYEDAISAYQRTLQMLPDLVEALTNCGAAYHHVGQWEKAKQLLERALEMRPDALPARINLCFLLLDKWRCDEAIQLGKDGLLIHPEDGDLHWVLAIGYLLSGDFERGWAEHEWRWHVKLQPLNLSLPKYIEPQWTGRESLQGRTILLFAEQGFGDSIQFLRYVPLVAERAGTVLLHIPPALIPLITHLPRNCRLVHENEPRFPSDYYCPLMSLPWAFGTTLETVPAAVPYLHGDSDRLLRWERRLGPRTGLRVGVAWSGNPAHHNDRNRSIPLEALASISCANVQFVSVQKEIRDNDRAASAKWHGLLHFGDDLESFADTAALMQAMDLVISVDTSVAHLAGALGLPLWLLLPYRPDWRWMADRADSPWYPTARLFRQDERLNWTPVLEAVRTELEMRAASFA